MKRFLIFLLILSWVGIAEGTEYYMRADGTAANKAAATGPCGTVGNCMNMTVHNGETFSGDDIIYLCDDGGVYRAQMTVPSSGTDGHVITYAEATGDSPIIDGSDVIETGGDDWTAATTSSVAEQETTGTNVSVGIMRAAGDYPAQGFKSDTGAITVPQVDVNLKKDGTITAGKNVWLEIWASTGTPPRPTGTDPVAISSTVEATTISTTLGWVTFTFSSPPTLTNDVVYFLIACADYDASDTNNIKWSLLAGDNYRGGDPYTRFIFTTAHPPALVGTWDQDHQFKIYKNVTSTTIWTATVTTEPKVVFFDGTLGTLVASQAACVAERNWFWAANVLSVYSASDPDTAYTSPGIEVGARHGILGMNKNYVTYDGLKVTKTNGYGIYLDSVNHVTVQNSEISYAAYFGILFGTASGDNLVDLCNIHHNGYGSDVGTSIWTWEDAGTAGHENYIRRSTIANNHICGMTINSNYYIIEYNTVSNNGITTAPYGANGIEIVNLANNGYAQHVIIRYNKVYGQISGGPDGTGIAADDYARYVDIYYNVSYGNDGPGIGLYKAKDINIYNNTTYGNMLDSAASHTVGAEIQVGSNTSGDNNIVIKNNTARATGATYGAIMIGPDSYNETGLSITNNLWYSTATNWYFWNTSGGDVLATWNALTGVGTDLNSDPLFIDATNGNFRLPVGSPCKDTGVSVGLTQDYQGKSVPAGAGVDIGAYEVSGAFLGLEVGSGAIGLGGSGTATLQ